MKTLFAPLAAAALLLPSVAFAQAYDPGSAQPAPASPNLGTTAANDAVEAAVDARTAMNAEGQAQYDADRAAYIAALMRHDRAVDRADARYVRQQAAYADAMAVWRWQVDRCKRGSQRACDLPTPNPADFY